MTDSAPRWLGQTMDPGLNWVCGFSPTPGHPTCLVDAVWHGFLLDDTGAAIVAMMSCCDEHKRFIDMNAHYVHPLGSPCALPGSRFKWPENFCYLDTDERHLAEVVQAQKTITRSGG